MNPENQTPKAGDRVYLVGHRIPLPRYISEYRSTDGIVVFTNGEEVSLDRIMKSPVVRREAQ